MNHRMSLTLFLFAFSGLLLTNVTVAQSSATAATRPNILWITSEDNGPELGCYGDTFATTPNIDQLAAKGMKYTNCWSNAPVCAPARTTIVSGLYPTSLSAQHMRSQVTHPANLKLYPELFRELGYYCTNNAKEDYNLATSKKLWNESSQKAHWRNRKAGQPFFAVFNFQISHESQIRVRPHSPVHSADKVPVPPYHPDTPEVRRDWAQYYDKISEMDLQVGKLLAQLKEDRLEEDTIVFYYGDHGSGMPRSKRWLYQSGLLVPMIVHVPQRYQSLAGSQYKPSSTNERLVSFVDLVPTVLSLVGQSPAKELQGKAFLGKMATENPQYIYGFRDRMDERIDMARAIRDDRYAYIRNFYPHRPQGAYLNYMFQTPTTQVWKRMFDEGKLNEAQSAFWMPKPIEELYDLTADPFQLKNLAGDAEHQPTLLRMRDALKSWMIDICDLGLLPEGEVLERAGADAPYTFGHDPARFPVEKIFDAADLATRIQGDDLNQVLALRSAPDSGARFWGACGLLIRAEQNIQRDEVVKAARGMTIDPSRYVQCIANEVVARWGTPNDRAVAIQSLLRLSDARQTNAFVAITALNSLDWCAPTASEVGSTIKGLPDQVLGLPNRYDSYLPRLLERITEISQN
jgi:arylsulfatase A-like enzyme